MLGEFFDELETGHVSRSTRRRIVVAAAGLADNGNDVERR
jgi:hypothetical protein